VPHTVLSLLNETPSHASHIDRNVEPLPFREPRHVLVGHVDLVIIRYEDNHSVLYGRCLHRGAMMADGHLDGDNLICGLHGWDYGIQTGISAYNNSEVPNTALLDATALR
jgi:nitrite reductase/ring-hydroxylating ferredoxin subunit